MNKILNIILISFFIASCSNNPKTVKWHITEDSDIPINMAYNQCQFETSKLMQGYRYGYFNSNWSEVENYYISTCMRGKGFRAEEIIGEENIKKARLEQERLDRFTLRTDKNYILNNK